MPYDDTPTENAPALPAQPGEYTFSYDLAGRLPDGSPRSTIDDLDLFSPDSGTTNKDMMDFLDRVVTKVTFRGEPVIGRVKVKKITQDEDGDDRTETIIEERVEGVRGKGLPHECFPQLMKGIGRQIRDLYNPKN